MKYYIQTINGVMTKFTMKDKLKYILPKLNDINEYYHKSFTEEQFISRCEEEYEKGKLVFRNVDNYIKQLETRLWPILHEGQQFVEPIRPASSELIIQSYKGLIEKDTYYRIRAQERVNRILEEE